MPTFRYLAKRGPQDTVEGVLEAESRTSVLQHLAGLKLIPVRISEGAVAQTPSAVSPTHRMRGIRISARHLNQLTRQFASLVHAQVPLLRALGILKEQAPSAGMKSILGNIEEEVRQGQPLSAALANYPTIFAPLYISLTRAGEVAGTLDTVFERLATQADREEALRSKVRGALAYPLFIGVVGIGTVVFLLTAVMPRLLRLLTRFGGTLPLPTQMLLTLTEWCRQGWTWGLVAGMFLLVVIGLKRLGPNSQLMLHRASLKLPVVGEMIREVDLARFARSFGLLLDHGVSILQALEVALPVVGNRFIRQELGSLSARLRDGTSLAAGLKGLSVTTPFVLHTVAVGEESGKVAEALTGIANYYERELERVLSILASLLEPMMVLMMGGIVGFIVMAVLLPIFEMNVVAH